MEKLNKEQLEEFNEIIKICEEEDIELVEAVRLDQETTDKLDAINFLTFRIFNTSLVKGNLQVKLEKLSGPEIGLIKVHYIEADVLLVIVSAH